MDMLYIVMVVLVVEFLLAQEKHIFKRSGNKNKKLKKSVFMNSWAVIVHGDETMAKKVAAENGFINKGKVGQFF